MLITLETVRYMLLMLLPMVCLRTNDLLLGLGWVLLVKVLLME